MRGRPQSSAKNDRTDFSSLPPAKFEIKFDGFIIIMSFPGLVKWSG